MTTVEVGGHYITPRGRWVVCTGINHTNCMFSYVADGDVLTLSLTFAEEHLQATPRMGLS